MDVLRIVSAVIVGTGFLSALIVYIDINLGRYQSMSIMNIAWVITCTYSSFFGVFMYFKYGRAKKTTMSMAHMNKSSDTKHSCAAKTMSDKSKHTCGGHMPSCHSVDKPHPMWVKVFISSTHCGAGCGSADIVSENLIYYVGITFWGATIWASFIIDYVFALVFGIIFQYLNIHPMRPELSAAEAWWDAAKADVLSLTSFQIGMYGWMAIAHFLIHVPMAANTFTFWFMMQIGLTVGLFTAYPVNYLLIKTGIKVPCA